jgi:Ni/Fe-hydrogenase subunit HybB-like protein
VVPTGAPHVGTRVVNDVEALAFSIAGVWPIVVLALVGAFVYTVVAVIVARRVPVEDGGALPSPFSATGAPRLVARVAVLGAVYAVIYFVAGGIIYPFVREFYENKPLPSTGPLFALQALVRGPMFVGVGALVVMLVRASRATNALVVACTFAGLAGLTALVPPNPLFPDSIRLVHLAEVTISNAVYGLIVGWALTETFDRCYPNPAPTV